MIDKYMERFILNYFGDMPRLLERMGTRLINNGQSNFFCPWHENTRTPAMHLYKDDCGYLAWCFSEHKMFGSYDCYKSLGVDTKALANAMWESLSSEKQKELESLSGSERDLIEIPFKKSLQQFKKGSITYQQLLKDIVKTI